ncbi:MAG: glycosyltransferase [Sphingobacteriales bacterium]|nr:glycosyltransferase [Sphingobacteriales bacterium]
MNKIVKSESAQLEFFNQCRQLYLQAAAVSGETKFYFEVAETIVCIAFAGDSMVDIFTPALAHLQLPECREADVTFCVWDSDSSGVAMIDPPCRWSDFTDRGDISGFESQRIKTAFHWSDLSVVVMDLEQNIGVFWVKSPAKLPFWSKSAPLRTLFHWWMEKNKKQLLHAAAIGNEKGAVLISGKGGVGKSSTAIRCLEHGMNYLSDDYVIVQLEPQPVVFSLYCSAKIKHAETSEYAYFRNYLLPYEKNREEKALMILYPGLKDRLVEKLPVNAILIPEFCDHDETSITSVPYWTVQSAVSFTTLSHLPYAGRFTHELICGLCQEVPSFKLLLGKNRSEISPVIAKFLQKIQSEKPVVNQDIASLEKFPLISVVIPVYNGEKFIAEAISNVISQNYPALEIIVVNDGSTDNTENIVRSSGVELRYIYKENGGPASARNRGISEASGEFIAFLDADDFWPDKNLTRLIAEFQFDPKLKVVHGYGQLVKKDEQSGEWIYLGNPKESFPGYIGAGLYRKEVFQEVGLFDTFLKFGEDADWFNRARELNIPLKKLEEVTLYVRRHGQNMTEGKTLVELNVLQVFKKSLDRMRKQHPEIEHAMNPKRVSVIIPCYNAEKYLEEALQSVFHQYSKPLEIILIDDGSSDRSLDIAKKYTTKVRLLRQEHKGAAAARNLGIRHAAGDYLAFLDADDIWEKHHLFSLLKAFGDDLSLEMAFGQVEQFVSPELPDSSKLVIDDSLRVVAGGHPGAMLVKKEVFLKVGYLNEQLEVGEFVDWFARANHLNIKQAVIPEIIYRRRIHTTNQGILKREQYKDYAKILKENIERKRKS